MLTIEPCCTQKHWPKILHNLKDTSYVYFEGYGDMTLNELLPVVFDGFSDADVMLAVPVMPERLISTLRELTKRSWANPSGRGSVPLIKRFRIITDARSTKSPGVLDFCRELRSQCAGSGVASLQQNDTIIIVRDAYSTIMIFGSVNSRPSCQWTAFVTNDQGHIADVWSVLEARYKAFGVERPQTP